MQIQIQKGKTPITGTCYSISLHSLLAIVYSSCNKLPILISIAMDLQMFDEQLPLRNAR